MGNWLRMFGRLLLGGVVMTGLSSAAAAWGNVRCAGRSLSEAYANPQALELARAAVKGDAARIRELVAQGADVNHQEEGAAPLLMWPICANNVDGFHALLEVGANPNLLTRGHGKGSGVGLDLKEDGSEVRTGFTTMTLAAATANSEFLKLALQYGGDPNFPTEISGALPAPPLFSAAYYGLLENVKILVAGGADINRQDRIEKTLTAASLAIAAQRRYDIAYWMLDNGFVNDLQVLGSFAESSFPNEKWQPWKEKLINALREKGVHFPATSRLKDAIKNRVIPDGDVEDLIMGRKDFADYPLRSH
ncbi:ankyrin [Chromobacterium phragmitis]|uniref:ankyrin repeat domain-containing protein n=1 Tax=Chromobacterium phragmitis TaxID=2202141 RepID=UPI000DECA092|nr:ankyrin repeat domain-containing protein [Chromobacterium phragmitis]AXE31276.1 ankyrin [Chromobacterium phragmitis]